MEALKLLCAMKLLSTHVRGSDGMVENMNKTVDSSAGHGLRLQASKIFAAGETLLHDAWVRVKAATVCHAEVSAGARAGASGAASNPDAEIAVPPVCALMLQSDTGGSECPDLASIVLLLSGASPV